MMTGNDLLRAQGPDELNRRELWLKTLKLWWVIPAAMLAGAVIAWCAVSVLTLLNAQSRRYEAAAKLYIDFAYDETGTVYDYYNGATWTDLLTAHPVLWEGIEEGLKREAAAGADVEGVDKNVVREEVRAQILTDIRVMTVTVSDPRPERAAAIERAVASGLEYFGREMKEFTAISFLSDEEPVLVSWSVKTRNAVLLGLFLGFLAGLFGLLLARGLDDSVNVPEEAERRFGIPCLGVIPAKGQTLNAPLLGMFEASAAEFAEGCEGVVLADGDGRLAGDLEQFFPGKSVRALPGISASGNAGERLADGERVIAVIYSGRRNGTAADRLLSFLKRIGMPAEAVILAGADMRFLKRYYRDGEEQQDK
ncbi:MAG: hypothetical protein II759_05685 [Lachnospiraceae bacterium]|nr:hypothetical protein [Lachnospiraceae bacterium]